MHFPEEGQHMMFADGMEGDILLKHHLTVVYMEGSAQVFARILLHTGKELSIHSSDTVRRVNKPFAGYVFADSFQ